MNEKRPTSSPWRRWRPHGRLNPDSSRGRYQTSIMPICTNGRWVYDRRHTRRSRLESHTCPKPNWRYMTGQLPLAITQPLIKRIPALGATSHDNATAMTPVLHRHTNTTLALGNQQDPIPIFGYIARSASRAFPFPVLLFALDAQLFERALEVFRKGYLVGRLPARLFPSHRWASRG